jgi:predicted Zn-dependent peptidase
MLQDDPARFVHDLATGLAFSSHPLSRPIIGTETTVGSVTASQFQDYRHQFYSANHSVFVIAGDLSRLPILQAARDRAGLIKSATEVRPEPLVRASQQAIELLTKPTDQTHFVLASASPDAGLQADQARYAGYVLNTILGRGMSSRLFLEVREKRGLAYSIHSHYNTLEDGGLFSIYGGVNTDKATQALEAVISELRRLQDELVSPDELADAQNFIVGANDMQADSGMSLATWYGTDWLLGRYETHDEVATAVKAVSAQSVQELARTIFDPKHLVLSVIGPQTDQTPFARVLGSK